MPLRKQISQFSRCAGEDLSVAGPFGTRLLVESAPAFLRPAGRIVEEHHEVAEEKNIVSALHGVPRRSHLLRDRGDVGDPMRGHESNIGGASDQPVLVGTVVECGDDRLTLWRRGVIEGPLTENHRPSKSM